MGKTHKKREQLFCTRLQKWVKYNMKFTFGWEAKVVDTDQKNRLNYKDCIPKHQLSNLRLCGSQFIYKISDADQTEKPFDGISIAESPGYFFIYFYRRANKEFFVIELTKIQNEINSGSKSLTEDRAREIAYKIGYLK